MADKQIKIAVVVDPSKAASGVKAVTNDLDKLGTSATGTGSKLTSGLGGAFSKVEGVASKSLGAIGLDASKLGGTMGTALPLAVVAAGGAIAKFALDGAKKFGDLGEKVETFKGIAGSTAEDASRWVAVADDFGVSADELAGGFGKLAKTLGANAKALDEYGVTIIRAKDGTVDMNKTALNVIDTYNKTVDPTIKAKLATEAFGKSYTTLIPLIDEGTDTIVKRFKEVDGAQLMGDKKLKEAKDYRLAMDTLNDAMQDLQMTLGRQVIPLVVELSKQVDQAAGPLNKLSDAMPTGAVGKFIDVVLMGLNPVKLIGAAVDDLTNKWNKTFNTAALGVNIFKGLNTATAAVTEEFKKATIAGDGLGSGVIAVNKAAAEATKGHDALGDSIMALNKQWAAEKVQVDLSRKAHEEQEASLKNLQDAMHGTTNAALDVQQADLDAATAMGVYDKSLKDNKLTAGEHKQSFLDVQKSIFGASETYADYVVDLAKGAGKIVSATQETTVRNQAQIDKLHELQGTVAPGSELWNSIQAYIDMLNSIPKSIYTNVDTSIAGNAAGQKRYGVPGFAEGGTVPGPKGAPMLAVVHGGERVIPNGGSGGGTMVVNVTNYVSAGADPVAVGRATVEAIKAYERTSGPGWRN